MKKWLMPVSVAVMALITAAVAVLASRQVFGGTGSADFDDPRILWVLIALLIVFCAVQILCLCSYRFRLRKIGFYVFHVGLVAVLAGSFIYYLSGIKIVGAFPVRADGSSADAQVQMMKSNLLKGDGYTADFDSFYIGVTGFTVDYYEPVYDLYRVPASDTQEMTLIKSDIEADKDGRYDFGEFGVKTASDLSADTAVFLTDDVAAIPRRAVKYYGGDVTVMNLSNGRSVTQERIEVNKPLRVNGWKVYLMGFDEATRTASFIFKYDPAEYIELAGYWMLIIGAFLMAFVRDRKDGDAA